MLVLAAFFQSPDSLTSDSGVIVDDRLVLALETVLATHDLSPDTSKYDFSYIAKLPNEFREKLEKSLDSKGIARDPLIAFSNGIQDAKTDLQRGLLGVLSRGAEIEVFLDDLSCNGSRVYRHLLLQHGISLESVVGCSVMSPEAAYIDGYNRLMKAVIIEFLDYDIFTLSWEEIPNEIRQYGQDHFDEWQCEQHERSGT